MSPSLLTAFHEGKELLFDEEILVDDEELHLKIKAESERVTNPALSTSCFAILGFVISIVYIFAEFTASVK